MTGCWLWPECSGQKGMCLPVIVIDVDNVLVSEACSIPLLSRSDSFRMFSIDDHDFGNILTSEVCVCLLVIV